MATGDRTNKIVIELHGERCLHARSVGSPCSLCADSCPGTALRLEGPGGAPVINPARCMQCGQCLTACPLEVFESPSFTERQLVNRIKGDEPVSLRCFLPYGQLEALGQGPRTYQLGACLASLSPGVLFELALSRPCELRTERCEGCGLFARLRPTFEANVTAAFRMLHGVRASANLTESAPLFLPRLTVPQGDSPLAAPSARASIRALFGGVRRQASPAKKRSPLALRQRSKHVPAWRRRAAELWTRQGFSASGACDFAWPELVADPEKCRACGVCMQMCPTGSISHYLDGGVFSHVFVPGTCVNCGLCLAVCPESALSRDYRAFAHPFQGVECFSREAHRCERCGMPVLSGADDRLCPPCAAEAARPSLVSRIRAQLGVESPGDRAARERRQAQDDACEAPEGACKNRGTGERP